MVAGTIRLGEVAARVRIIDVHCDRCGRRGMLNTLRLLDVHGNLPIPELLAILSADCPRRIEEKAHDPCGIYAPELQKRLGSRRRDVSSS
jgi:hypothetical protein